MAPPAGSFVLMSAGAGQEALDRLSETDPNPNSVFTRNLLPLLEKPGMSHVDIAKELQISVEDAASGIGHTQRPSYYDEIRGRFQFRPGEVAMAPTPQVQVAPQVQAAPPVAAPQADPCRDAAAHWAGIGTNGNRKLYEEHLKLFPSCIFSSLAKAELEKPVIAPETECDRLAASPYDKDGIVPGLEFDRIDAEAAIRACFAALQEYPSSNRFLYQYGRALEKAQRYPEAIASYQKAAAAGYTSAMSNLALSYRDGNGVKKDVGKAIELLEKAVAAGNPLAMDNLAVIYRDGNVVKKDIGKAKELFERAVAAGNPLAMNHLAYLYREGDGVKKDMGKAVELYESAAATGHTDSMSNLASFYDEGRGVEKDPSRAVAFLVGSLRGRSSFSRDQMRSNSRAWSIETRRALQQQLKDAGVYDGPIDGSFGPATQAAIDKIYGVKAP